MEFNSIAFIVFSILFFSVNYFVRGAGKNIHWLLFVISSFIFYGWWNWYYLVIIIVSGLIDFGAAMYIAKYPRYKKLLLVVSLTCNLGILMFFKYSAFLLTKIVWFSSSLGLVIPNESNFFNEIILPVGISFYTFQSMSYTIDVYKGELLPTKNVLHFFSYLSLFPQLVAGPIVRAKDFLPQLLKTRVVSGIEKWNGLKLISLGYFKKTVLADNIAPLVNSAFTNDLSNGSSGYWWVVMIGFSIQIYFDFSGYSDIARGLAKWMGFHFRINFNHPYFSKSLKEFWARWHISLSTWFRDYVYIPLGGGRKGKFRSSVNVILTMTTSGLWHGASAHFIVWGFLHGLLLVVERLLKWPPWMGKFWFTRTIEYMLTMVLIVTSWTFFRASSSSQAFDIIGYLFSFNSSGYWGVKEVFRVGCIFISISILIEAGVALTMPFWRKHRKHLLVICLDVIVVSLMLLSSIYLRGKGHEFIYFQF